MKVKLIIFFICLNFLSISQPLLEKSSKLNKKRLISISVLNAGLWTGSIGSLYYVWYKDFSKTKFHTFNDSKEWQQMDKFGHFTTAYQFSRSSADLYNWAGLDSKKALCIGGGYAFSYLLTFELLDAYNKEWGFSWSDIGANTSGILLYGIQEYFWGKQFIKPKFSYHSTDLASYRPSILGNGGVESVLKDYNGQTYWLNFNPISMINQNTKFPKWINLAIGYSINNQLIGDGGTFVTTENNNQLSFTPYRQFYLSLGIDWEEIPVKSKALKLLFRGLNFVKIPFPAIEFSKQGVKGYGLYF